MREKAGAYPCYTALTGIMTEKIGGGVYDVGTSYITSRSSIAQNVL